MTNKHAALRKFKTNVAKQHKKSAVPQSSSNSGQWFTAQFVALEASTSLAQISINGYTYRGVPRLINAWSSTPSAGTSLRVLQVGSMFEIHGVLIGQPELASYIGAGE